MGDVAISDPAAVAGFDLRNLPAGFHDDPFPWYRALREHSPIHPLPGGGVLLTRHADCLAVYKDPQLFSSDKTREFAPKFGASPLYTHHTTSLVFNDPPLHTRVRRIIAGALTPRAVADLEPSVTALVDGLIGRMESMGRVDLVHDFAAAIPVEVIGNLLDVPREEREPLRDWSLAILGALEPAPDDDVLERGNAAVEAFTSYLAGLVERRRQRPGDPGKDVLTRLIQGEATGDRLSEVELLQNCIFILNAGHETTTNLIASALVTLAAHPDAVARIVADFAMVKTAVEEVLRFESPNQLGNRSTTAEVEIGGVMLAPGTSITIGIGAANRDPAEFADPDRFDIARQPNRHLAFASGIHACVGAAVARLEARIALDRFLGRFPRYGLDGPPVRSRRARFRGFLAIPAKLG